MAREEFIDSLRLAFRLLASPGISRAQGALTDDSINSKLNAAELWLTPKSVKGFDHADFAAWPRKEREELTKEVGAF